MIKEKARKILFIIPSLNGGGAERILLNIIKLLDREKFTPYLVILENKGEYLDQVPEDTPIYYLNERSKGFIWLIVLSLAYKIYPRIKPDIIVSFIDYANLGSIIARILYVKGVPIVISQHNFTSLSLKNKRLKNILPLLFRVIYPMANKIIAVSKAMAADLTSNFGIARKNMQVIYNSLDLRHIKQLAKESTSSVAKEAIPTIVSCGRLTKQKNYPFLLRSFAKVVRQVDAKLLILGQGEEKASLEQLSFDLGIRNKVEFLGFKKNPFVYMANADIFVLSSDWEGLPMVILEAMACGVPVISTRCPSGPDEIITDGVNGLLVPTGDVEAMAEAIIKLLKDKPLRQRLAEGGKKRAEDFNAERMVIEYQNVFESTIKEFWGKHNRKSRDNHESSL
jgi:glycosyltransferase involved in cell wall biosynthesis